MRQKKEMPEGERERKGVRKGGKEREREIEKKRKGGGKEGRGKKAGHCGQRRLSPTRDPLRTCAEDIRES